jgi:acyl-CoA synthetase (AMP-forming)/AMP-acid ligase II
MNGWNFADVWEVVADCIPDTPAAIHGDRRVSWRDFERRADGVARTLLSADTTQQDKVAVYLYNVPEYLEAMFAAFKAGLVPVNTNYRYRDDELVYLWDNADAIAVVFHGTFAETIERIRDRVPGVRLWLWVDDESGPCPPWATAYEDAAAQAEGDSTRTVAPWGRRGDDLLIIYTGGTTGMPKGVMWRQDDLFVMLNGSTPRPFGPEPDLDRVRELVTGPAFVSLPAAPLMHGTGNFTSLAAMSVGATVVTLTGRSYDPVELLDTIGRERVNSIAWVGDPFARPLLQALDAEPDRWDISSLALLISSGAMWSESVKEGLLRHKPDMILADQFASSEALGLGSSFSSGASATRTARFVLGENARVITDDGRDAVPGSGEIGRVAVRGRMPLGYYKDETKTASTFLVIDGERYSVPGDYATVEADGTLNLLGRGSVCINSGGEKIFPEEVEEAVKLHPMVQDAVAVGVPDERFGEAVTVVVEPVPDGVIDERDLIAHVKGRLAAFKAPRRVFTVESIVRAPNGKVDYRRLRRLAEERLAAGAPSPSPT